MDRNSEYTGTHKVVLPSGYMNSVEAVFELYDEQLAAVGNDLNCPGLNLTTAQKIIRSGMATLGIWLIQAIWITCT